MCKLPGTWTSFDHLEESITLDELTLLLGKYMEIENSRREFAASLEGIDLSGSAQKSESDFERVRRNAMAKANNISEEELAFAEMGIDIEGVA